MFKSGYIAILGIPNAGKSSLLNAILGEKVAIVTAKPQTTRERITGVFTTETAQMVFLDVPGIHHSDKKLNQYMLQQISEAVEDADVLLYLVPLDWPLDSLFLEVFRSNQERYPKKKALLAVNKVDLPTSEQRVSLETVKNQFPGITAYPVSALKKEGLADLLLDLEAALPEGPAYYPEDEFTDKTVRELASEIIREKVMEMTHQEIPYSVAVSIEAFKEGHPQTRIEALIIVEQDSQKGMVIGAGGRMIKEIGVRARADIESLVGSKIFLDLRVKVDKNWTKDPAKLARYGYPLNRKK